MKKRNLIKAISGSIAVLITTNAFAGDYLIESGQSSIAFSATRTTFNQFWVGSEKQPGVPGGGDIERNSYRSYFYYGLGTDFALDLSVGYGEVTTGLTKSDDFTDSQIGLSWQLAKQGESPLDWMVRTGVNIAGGYETGLISALGDGENGIDLMTKFGGNFGSSASRGDVEIGYTLNDGDVPDSLRLRAGPTIPFGNGLSIDLSGIYATGTSGIDIGGEGFTGLGDLPKVKEQATAGEVGLSLSSQYGYYRMSVSKVFDGRNIGDELTVGLFGAFSF